MIQYKLKGLTHRIPGCECDFYYDRTTNVPQFVSPPVAGIIVKQECSIHRNKIQGFGHDCECKAEEHYRRTTAKKFERDASDCDRHRNSEELRRQMDAARLIDPPFILPVTPTVMK